MPDKHTHTVLRHKYRNTLYMHTVSSDHHIGKRFKSQFVLDARQLKAMLFTIIRGWFGHDFMLPIPTVIEKLYVAKYRSSILSGKNVMCGYNV